MRGKLVGSGHLGVSAQMRLQHRQPLNTSRLVVGSALCAAKRQRTIGCVCGDLVLLPPPPLLANKPR